MCSTLSAKVREAKEEGGRKCLHKAILVMMMTLPAREEKRNKRTCNVMS
jgi:hypothetical protein